MGSVRHHREYMLQNIFEISVVEARSCLFVLFDVLHQSEQDLEAGVGHVSHRMLESPYDTVEDELELLGRYAEERRETMVVDGLE